MQMGCGRKPWRVYRERASGSAGATYWRSTHRREPRAKVIMIAESEQALSRESVGGMLRGKVKVVMPMRDVDSRERESRITARRR